MPTLDINARTVAKAIAESVPGAKQAEISDSRARGLRLRIGATGALWQYRYEKLGKGVRFDLGSVNDWSLAEARELAADAAAHRRQGGDVDAGWLETMLVKHGRKEAAQVVVKSWDWITARDEYLAEVERVNKRKTFVDYRNRLTNTPELARFVGRQVATISLDDAAQAVADIHARGVESQAEHVAAIISAFFTWLARPGRRKDTGVEKARMADLEAPPRTLLTKATVKKKYAPPLHEVGRVMAIARSGALEEQIGLAMQLLCYTVQRVTFVAHAESGAMEYAADRSTGLWIMDPFNRKTALRRDDTTNHVVPLPPSAWRVVERALQLTGDEGEFLFPGMHPNNRGVIPPTMSESAIQHNLSYFPGVVATPHDLRRSFTKFGQSKFEWGIEGSRSILDHNEGHATDDTTVRAYLHDGSGPKWDIMRKWVGLVDEATQEALEFDKRLADVEWLRASIIRKRTEIKDRKRVDKGLPPKRLGVSLAKPGIAA